MMGILHLFWVSFFIMVLFDIINYIVFKAAYKGHKEVVKELLYHNADIEAKNSNGTTSLIKGIFVDYYVI
jgi:hypothetical protein